MNPTPAPIHDIAGPMALPAYPVPLVIAGAAAVVALGLFLVWFFRFRKHAMVLTPRQKALAALGALSSEGLDSYAFGVRASDILRGYIRDQYGLDAVNKTSLEFLESLRGHPVFDDNEKASLAAFLESADLMKFARVKAGEGEIRMLMDSARGLVTAEKGTVGV